MDPRMFRGSLSSPRAHRLKSGSECYVTIPLARKACGRSRWMGSFPERQNSTLTPTLIPAGLGLDKSNVPFSMAITGHEAEGG